MGENLLLLEYINLAFLSIPENSALSDASQRDCEKVDICIMETRQMPTFGQDWSPKEKKRQDIVVVGKMDWIQLGVFLSNLLLL